MKKFLLLLILSLGLSAFAADSVRIYNPSNLVVTGSLAGTVTLNSESPSGDAATAATAEGSPARVFVPIQNNNLNTNLYSALNTTLYDVTNAANVVNFPLSVTTGASTPNYLYAAVKQGTSYYAVAKLAISANSSDKFTSFPLSLLDICKAITANGGNCDKFKVGSAITDRGIIKPLVYFFISSEVIDITGSTTVSLTDKPGGVFFETQMSNKVYTASELLTSISDLKVGDRRVILTYSANSTMDSSLFKKVVIFSYTDTSTVKAGGGTFGSLNGQGSLLNRDVTSTQSGEYTLNDLQNNVIYNVALAFQDKFLFVTTFSNSKIGQPLEIQELLKKQSCYLLTAGFGEEHFVINYFRHYRDHVLAKSYFGQQFIKVYYRSAPHYAEIIYKSEFMRLTIRILAYIMYFFFRFYWLIFLGLGLIYALNLRKNKILSPQGDL